jgi:hypothetical protein
MVSSRARPEATRERLIEHLTRRLDPATCDLLPQGVVSHVLDKAGEEPGFFAVLNAPNLEQAKAMIEASTELLTGPQADVLNVLPLKGRSW